MKKIESWTNPKNSKFNSLSISIENIIINSGIGGKDFFSKDDFSNPYHGFVYSTTYMEESPSEARLSIITETRYPIMLIWESIVKTYLPGAELVFSISNIEKELFFTNDPEVCGTYFIPYSPYCLKNDCCTKEELLELLQDIENTDEDDLETLILYAPADFYFYKWKPLEEIEKENKKNKVCLEELNPGEVFKVGKYDFIVLDQDMRNHTTKVISKNFMTENVVFDNDTRDYSKSNLKKVIEENIQPLIEEEICLQMRT